MSLTLSNKKVTKVTYDFAVDGGAQGTINLNGYLPANVLVTGVWIREVTNVTGASATIKLVCGSTDISAALTGTNIVTGVATLIGSATAVYVSTAGQLKVTIATADVTAGKLEYFVEYVDNN